MVSSLRRRYLHAIRSFHCWRCFKASGRSSSRMNDMSLFMRPWKLACGISQSGIAKHLIPQYILFHMVRTFPRLSFHNLTLVVLDPTWKLSYVQVAWDAQDVEDNMDRLRKIVGGLSIFLCSACLNLAFYLVPQISYKISCCKEGSTTCCRCRKYN